MAQFERSEEETIQALKDWWKENGRAVIAGVLLGIGGIVGVRYWFDYQSQNRQQASQLYAQMQAALQGGQQDVANQMTATLRQEYDGTVYASLAALGMARLLLENDDRAGAEQQLRWVMDNAGADEYRHLARQRLARLLLAQGQPDAAAGLLEGVEAGGYESIYAEIRGDIAVARQQPDTAHNEYQLALQGATDPLRRRLLEMKLAELPGNTGQSEVAR